MRENKITPLTKFPTEALVWLYRKNRICRTYTPWNCHKLLEVSTLILSLKVCIGEER